MSPTTLATLVALLSLSSPELDIRTEAVDSLLENAEARFEERIEDTLEHRSEVFEPNGFAFCHDPTFGQLQPVPGKRFCALLDETSDAICPEARRSCEQWRTVADWLEDSEDSGWADVFEIFDLSPMTARLFIAVVVLLLAALILPPLLRYLFSNPNIDDRGEDIVDDVPMGPLARLPKAAVSKLLARARAALAEGAPEVGLRWLHAALLKHLDERGWVEFHASRTHGDYLRRLSPELPIRESFRTAASQLDRLQFGDGHVEAAEVEMLLATSELAIANTPRSREWTGAISSLVLLLSSLSLQGCQSDLPIYLDRGPAGLAALPQLVEAVGFEEVLRERNLADAPWASTYVFYSASLPSDLDTEGGLEAVINDGADVLVIDTARSATLHLPVTSTVSGSEEPVRLRAAPGAMSGACGRTFSGFLAALESKGPRVPGGHRYLVEDPAFSELYGGEATVEPLVVDESELGAYALCVTAEGVEYPSIWLADHDLLANASLTVEANATVVAALFASVDAPDAVIAFVDDDARYGPTSADWDGDGPNPRDALEGSALLPFMAQLMAVLVVAAIAAGAAFGPLRGRRQRSRRRFVEHVEAVGDWYSRSGAEGRRHCARALARWVVHSERRHAGSDHDALARTLAERYELEEAFVTEGLSFGLEDDQTLSTDPRDPSPEALQALSVMAAGPQGRTPSHPRSPS